MSKGNGLPKLAHKDIVNRLAATKRRGWIVRSSPTSVYLSRNVAGKTITFRLDKIPGSNTLYTLEPGHYSFSSPISYYDFLTPEERYSRNRVGIEAVIRLLKDCDVWKRIDNREGYICVNGANKRLQERSLKRTISAELHNLIS